MASRKYMALLRRWMQGGVVTSGWAGYSLLKGIDDLLWGGLCPPAVNSGNAAAGSEARLPLKPSGLQPGRSHNGPFHGDFGELDFVFVVGKRSSAGDGGITGGFCRFGVDRATDDGGGSFPADPR